MFVDGSLIGVAEDVGDLLNHFVDNEGLGWVRLGSLFDNFGNLVLESRVGCEFNNEPLLDCDFICPHLYYTLSLT